MRDMTHRERFRADFPKLMPVDSSSNATMLKWADEEGYITLVLFEGEQFYTRHDLDKAIMWKDKVGVTL